jgi:hypothetical protein
MATVKGFVCQKPRASDGWQRLGSEMVPLAPPRLFMWVTRAFFLFALTTTALPASAAVLIAVNKSTQQMSISVDGVPRYRFAVSTGRAGYGTPSGTYHPQRLAASWFSKLYYNSPMPHSIFFHGGFAIHGSYEINRLGGPASHGCIRLHPANAATLFELVKSEGLDATTIVVSGSNPVLASSPGHRHSDMEDGTGQLTRIATGVITDNLQTTTGVRSLECFRSSIRTDPSMVLCTMVATLPLVGGADRLRAGRAPPSLRGL